MLSVMRGMALAPPYLATFNYLSPLPVASLGGSPPFFHLARLSTAKRHGISPTARISNLYLYITLDATEL